MLCENEFKDCEICDNRWVVMVDDAKGEEIYFCFENESDACLCLDEIKSSCGCYCGVLIKPKTAILFVPRGANK